MSDAELPSEIGDYQLYVLPEGQQHPFLGAQGVLHTP